MCWLIIVEVNECVGRSCMKIIFEHTFFIYSRMLATVKLSTSYELCVYDGMLVVPMRGR
jgi:hypothetical protein